MLLVNVDIHSRKLIDELPVDGVNFISKLQSHCANMTFADKSRYDRLSHKATHKGGEGESSTGTFHRGESLSLWKIFLSGRIMASWRMKRSPERCTGFA